MLGFKWKALSERAGSQQIAIYFYILILISHCNGCFEFKGFEKIRVFTKRSRRRPVFYTQGGHESALNIFRSTIHRNFFHREMLKEVS